MKDEGIVAKVGADPIAGDVWQTAARLYAAMNRVAGQPSPAPEKTLDRLINEVLVLHKADLEAAQHRLSSSSAKAA